MNVVAYRRVSTDKQAEEGFGMEVQKQAIETWAAQHGHRVAAWTGDEGVSGSNGLDSRQGLPDALALLDSGEVDGLVVYRLDRLARDLILQETILRDLRLRKLNRKPAPACVFSTSAAEDDYLKDDPEDPSRKLIRTILGAVAEYERAVIGLRTSRGKRVKKRRGGYIGGFSNRYGYKVQDGQWVEDPEQQEVVQQVVALHAGGHRAGGLTLHAVADHLNSTGVPSPTGAGWNHVMVKRIVDRSTTP